MTVSLVPQSARGVQYESRPVLTLPDEETPKGSLVVPRDLKGEGEASLLQQLVDSDLVDSVVVGQMQSQRVLQQGPGFATLLPFRAPADFNCLPHAVAIAMRGYEDKDRQLRALIRRNMERCCPAAPYFRAQWTNAILHLDRKAFGQEVERSKLEWQREWEAEMQLVADDRSSLTEIHVFILAHVVRRPIIIYSPAFVKDQDGKDLAPIHFGGLYLPLLLPAEDCSSASPVLLLYLNSHFSPLVPVEPEDGELLVAPLADSDGAYLPIHFVDQDAFPPGGAEWRELLDRYLRVHRDAALPCHGAVLEAGDRYTMPPEGEAAQPPAEISIPLPPAEASLTGSGQTPRSTTSRTSSIGHSCASSSDLAAARVSLLVAPSFPPAMPAEASHVSFPRRSLSPRPGQLAPAVFPTSTKPAVRSKSCVALSSSAVLSPAPRQSVSPAPPRPRPGDAHDRPPVQPPSRTFVRPPAVSKAVSPTPRDSTVRRPSNPNPLSPTSPTSPQSDRFGPDPQCRTQRAISLAVAATARPRGASPTLNARRGTCVGVSPVRAELGGPPTAASQQAPPSARGAPHPGLAEAERPNEVAYCPVSRSTSLDTNLYLACPNSARRLSAPPASALLPMPLSARVLPTGPGLAPAGSPFQRRPSSPRARSPTLAACDPHAGPAQRPAIPRSPPACLRALGPAPRDDSPAPGAVVSVKKNPQSALVAAERLGRATPVLRSRTAALSPTPAAAAAPPPAEQKLLRPRIDSLTTSRLPTQSPRPMTSKA